MGRQAAQLGPFVGFALPLLRRGRLADEQREFTLSVIGLLVTLCRAAWSPARPLGDKFRSTRTREADELLIAPDRPTVSGGQGLVSSQGAFRQNLGLAKPVGR
jgi:hypothetical protein